MFTMDIPIYSFFFCVWLTTVQGTPQVTMVTYTGRDTVIDCPIQETFTYPAWTGPPGDGTGRLTVYTSDGSPQISPNLPHKDRVVYSFNKRSLVIKNIQTSDAGVYICTNTLDGVSYRGQNTVNVKTQTVRLVNGRNHSEGRIEVLNNGVWGTVCDDDWDHTDAQVVCRQLGFGEGLAFPGAYFGRGSGEIWLDDVSCDGTELDLLDCSHAGIGVENCGHDEDAGVMCTELRLVNGSSRYEGRVEVWYNGEWGTVCDEGFGEVEAEVVCKQLGLSGDALYYPKAHFGQGSAPILLDGVKCDGSEPSLLNCSHGGIGQHNCGHGDDVGVRCIGSVRLVDGNNSRQGRLEILFNGEWGTVCGVYWDHKDAHVVCSQLGFGGGIALNNAYFGEGSGRVWLRDARCEGTETSLIHCSGPGYYNSRCSHSQDASVMCTSLRLVNGSSRYEGRLEVWHNGEWGTVCDEGFGEVEAKVVCKQLGLSSDALYYPKAHFGQGSAPILLDGVKCDGSEPSLLNCSHGGIGQHNCGHGDDVGVRCIGSVRLVDGNNSRQGRLEILFNGEWGTVCDAGWDHKVAQVVCRQLGFGGGIALRYAHFGRGSGREWLRGVGCEGTETSLFHCSGPGYYNSRCGHHLDASVMCTSLRLVNGSSRYEGRLEVWHNGEWGTVCDEGFGEVEAKVVCKQLGLSGDALYYPKAHFGQGSAPILLDGVKCDGSEPSLLNCSHGGIGQHNCGHGDDVGVRCIGSVRLVDGINPRQGRLEILFNGEWGTVCQAGWDHRDAQVVCRQLGFGDGVALDYAYFGRGSGREWLHGVGCEGTESSLFQCSGPRYYNIDRGHYRDASVMCTSLRLVNGSSRYEGRVEVWHNGEWGTVCDAGFGEVEAKVVCKYLGITGDVLSYPKAHFGQGSGPILLDDVKCDGSEPSLLNCSHGGIGQHNCGHGDDVGVRCIGSVRLVDGNNSRQGRLEVLFNGEWGTVCHGGWNHKDAQVVCRQLGFGQGTTLSLGSRRTARARLLSYVGCKGTELSVFHCPMYDAYNTYCVGKDAAVVCTTQVITNITGNREITSDGTSNLTLTCTTTAIRVSSIKWYLESSLISESGDFTPKTEPNGTVSQELTVMPTRDMNGDVIKCEVWEKLWPVDTARETLNIMYSPVATISEGTSKTVTEGDTTGGLLHCTADSNPPSTSTFTWYHGNRRIQQDTIGVYNLVPVNRTKAGVYKCVASNSIAPDSEARINISVQYSPTATISEGSSKTVTEGDTTNGLLHCTADSNPPSTFTWYHGNRRIQQDTIGVYNLVPVNRTKAGVYKCVASNSIAPDSEARINISVQSPPSESDTPIYIYIVVGAVVAAVVAVVIVAGLVVCRRSTKRTDRGTAHVSDDPSQAVEDSTRNREIIPMHGIVPSTETGGNDVASSTSTTSNDDLHQIMEDVDVNVQSGDSVSGASNRSNDDLNQIVGSVDVYGDEVDGARRPSLVLGSEEC